MFVSPGLLLRPVRASRALLWTLPLPITFLKTSAQPEDDEEESPPQILNKDRTAVTIKPGGQGSESGGCGENKRETVMLGCCT